MSAPTSSLRTNLASRPSALSDIWMELLRSAPPPPSGKTRQIELPPPPQDFSATRAPTPPQPQQREPICLNSDSENETSGKKRKSSLDEEQKGLKEKSQLQFHQFQYTVKPKQIRNPKTRRLTDDPNQACRMCGRTDTPEWRRGPDGYASLCNICGLKYAKKIKREMETGKNQPKNGKIPISSLLN
eukprot:TRINITY_DN2560_c0_g1_i1.p1 TRINITY_DN2560_c0_g1~~TRINITY_DN2560_c0_g1_i1.p1  ORF type:complete len:186 (-),score=36.41 TRINITY_DN2560_c0_g1_i1:285-842(-)